LEKLPLLSIVTKSVSLSHTYSGKKTDLFNQSSKTQESTTKDFRPLIGASIGFKNGISTNIQYTTTETNQNQLRYSQGKTKKISSNFTITAKYRRRGGIKLPFLRRKLDNAIDFSLTFTKSYNATQQSTGQGGRFVDSARTKNWSFQPKITYSFTNTLQGGMYFELGERDDLRAGKTKITGFGLNAKIILAGR
jgi:cell surface protein SprA